MSKGPKIPILKTDLYQHQISNLQFHMRFNKTADWSECGTGKSLTALAKFALLYHLGEANKMLVVCPLSVIGTWVSEVHKHSEFRCSVVHGSMEEKLAALKQKAEVFITTYDAIRGSKQHNTAGTLLSFILSSRFDYLVIDEVTMVKSIKAQRTKAIMFLADRTKFSMALSGTPITNNPTSVFTIYRIADGGATFGQNIYKAQNTFFRNVGGNFPIYELRPNLLDTFKDKLYHRAVRVTKEEALDLPPQIFTPRYCFISGEQEKIYIRAAHELVKELELPEGTVNVNSLLAKMSKLSQITGGFVYTDDQIARFNPNPKIEMVKETLELIPEGEQVVIFCRWREEISQLNYDLSTLGYTIEVLHGGVSQSDRGRIVSDFAQNKTQILIAQEGTGGYGINLQTAWNVIYFSMTFSVIEFVQSRDRIHRSGQLADKCLYYIMFAQNTIDEYIWNKLQSKVDLAESLTNKASQLELKNALKKILNS